MENTDWDSVLQFVSEPMDMEFRTSSNADNLKLLNERIEISLLSLLVNLPHRLYVGYLMPSRGLLTKIDFRT